MTPCLRFKSGVTLNGLQPAGARILSVLDQATFQINRDLTVTSGTDSHGPDDPHTRGCAFDVRTLDLPEATIFTLVPWLKKKLGQDFTVLYEVPKPPLGILAAVAFVNPKASAAHCHIQLRKGFGVYPTPDAPSRPTA